ncbi:NifU family protein [bacterium]|jgi:Fe-S cluster biogenesis protein NfuA|nr:NifU family protein [Bacteroidota bacterium]MDA7625747.1 NifU family protein [bacterium]MDF1867107.1 NifU family protein [Saprospiraceae bacterium]
MTTIERSALYQQIESALDTVRPHLAVDGGNVELVEITEDMTVKVKWMGNCQNCNMSAMTMKAGIEQAIMSKVPNINKVVAIN